MYLQHELFKFKQKLDGVKKKFQKLRVYKHQGTDVQGAESKTYLLL